MSELDERLDLGRMRDLRGRYAHAWVRRVLIVLLAAPVVLALSGALGQRTSTLRAAGGGGAQLQVDVPDTLRAGLLWRGRIIVRAQLDIKLPRIILGDGWVESMQLNTLEPAPESEAARGSRVVLSYPEIKAGEELHVYLQLQANPTSLGAQDMSVEIDDETAPLARIAHTTRVLP
jgi:hypothetical protein